MAHSPLGPSVLHMRLACPGSYALEKQFPQEDKTSEAAATGTVAHAFIEDILRGERQRLPKVGTKVEQDGYTIEVTEDMKKGIKMMVDFCQDIIERAESYWVETRVDLDSMWDSEPQESIFGTVDFGAHDIDMSILDVVDYKNGRIPVNPTRNPQGMAYALGICLQLVDFPDIVRITIVQPNAMDGSEAIQTWETTGLDLLRWGYETLMPGVDACFEDDPVLFAGDHCRFCPAKAGCPALEAEAKQIAQEVFEPIGTPVSAEELTNDRLADILTKAEMLNGWVNAVREEASKRIEEGQDIPGWKLVPKRANRRWTDAAEVEKLLHGDDTFYDKKLKSPPQMEKSSPKTYEHLSNEGFVTSKSTGTTLAPDSDKRKAVKAVKAADVFERIDNG